MTQPYYSPTYPISVPKLVGRRYFIKLANTDDSLFRVPADDTYLKIITVLTRQLKINYNQEKYTDGESQLRYKGRDAIQMDLNVLTLDERDRDRLLVWQYYGYDVSLMEVFEDDVGNPLLFAIGAIEIERWRITQITASNDPGNLVTGGYRITLEEKGFFDEDPNPQDGFSLFKYSMLIEKDASPYYVPNTWNPAAPEDSVGLQLGTDVNRAYSNRFNMASIAFGEQIVEWKGRNNIKLDFTITTSSFDEISIISWAYENVIAVELYEWANYGEMLAARKFALGLNNVEGTYSGFGNTNPIQPSKWRITDFSFIEINLSEFQARITLTELV